MDIQTDDVDFWDCLLYAWWRWLGSLPAKHRCDQTILQWTTSLPLLFWLRRCSCGNGISTRIDRVHQLFCSNVYSQSLDQILDNWKHLHFGPRGAFRNASWRSNGGYDGRSNGFKCHDLHLHGKECRCRSPIHTQSALVVSALPFPTAWKEEKVCCRTWAQYNCLLCSYETLSDEDIKPCNYLPQQHREWTTLPFSISESTNISCNPMEEQSSESYGIYHSFPFHCCQKADCLTLYSL